VKTVEVVAAIIKQGNEIFVTCRGYGEFKDMWEFPGGKIESGETREEALVREIKEELELDIHVSKYVTTIDYDYPNFNLIMHCFLCDVCGGKIHLNVHNDAKWIPLNELDKLTWVPADILVMEELKKV
jgi:8-oxo-dGTP diphosphatase